MYKRIVVGVAKTDSAERAVEVATDLAERYEAELHLVMAFSSSNTGGRHPRDDAESHLSLLGTMSPVRVRTHALPGDPAEEVLRVASEVGADLIVVGNKGMQGKKGRLLGSVPNSIAHGASCSVLIADTTS